MPKRALGHLKNLGNHADNNTKKTTLSKIRKFFSRKGKDAPGKENEVAGAPKKAGGRPRKADVSQDVGASGDRSLSKRVINIDTRVSEAMDASNTLENENPIEFGIPVYQPLEGFVCVDAHDIDGDADGALPPAIDIQSIGSGSESGSASGEDEDLGPTFRYQPQRGEGTSWAHRKPPTELQALDALQDVENLLRPQYKKNMNQKRYKTYTGSNWSKSILQAIRSLFRLYTGDHSEVKGKWGKAADQAATATGYKSSRSLRERAKEFISTRKAPETRYGTWAGCRIEEDKEFQQDLNIYLQGKGKYVQARDIQIYLNDPETREKYGMEKSIHISTAKRWMRKIGYRWVRSHKGLYADGHERDDVVEDRKKFLKIWYEYEPRMHTWTGDNFDVQEPLNLPPETRPVVPWFHDETIYYAHDRRQACWVKEDESPTPYQKGEGFSLMDGEYVSAEYGFGRSPDGKETARVIFKPGKNRDGYFDNEDVLAQATKFMDILDKWYPNDEHLLIYDNATTHKKRSDTAPSARRMPKFTPQEGMNWGVEVTDRGLDGKPIICPDGKPKKIKVKMNHGYFSDGRPQDFYFPEGHPRAGVFKGMMVILKERGYQYAEKLRAECPKFKCAPGATYCCCRRLLFNQPDFIDVKSLLEEHCAKRGYRVIFLPKYHCELNFLEMVWGKSKREYRLYPPSSKEEDLQANMLKALETVTITDMRKFARRAQKFMLFYYLGLDGKWAAWANKKFRGHRVTPEKLMETLDDEGIQYNKSVIF